jgi:sulfide:quinone oxidoreductase
MCAAAVSSPRVLVVGGGVGGLEAVLALQSLAADRVHLELLTPGRHFSYRSSAVGEPFGTAVVRRFSLDEFGADRNVPIHRDALARARLDDRVVETQGGRSIGFDVLVLAVGARACEGVRGALTFRGPQDADRIRALVDDVRDGRVRRVAFAVPAGTSWTLPAYELALQTAAAVQSLAPAAQLSLVTAEPAPLAALGEAAGALAGELLAAAGVTVHLAARPEELVDGTLRADTVQLPADRVVALPRLEGPHLRGVPSDALGFVAVDDRMRALGQDDVYAVGDVAACGIKQGGLAAQQADTAALAIAAGAGAEVEVTPFRPVLRALLATGTAVHYVRAMPGGASEVSSDPLWWPPAKVAGRHLAAYLALH